MRLRSKQLGNRISEISINFEGNKTDEMLQEKYNYCLQEFAVADTVIKDGYESYLGIGIYENKDFYNKNGILYNVHEKLEMFNKELRYIITYNVFKIRINDVETKLNRQYTYTCKYHRGFRSTLDKFIKDLYKDGTIVQFYN